LDVFFSQINDQSDCVAPHQKDKYAYCTALSRRGKVLVLIIQILHTAQFNNLIAFPLYLKTCSLRLDWKRPAVRPQQRYLLNTKLSRGI